MATTTYNAAALHGAGMPVVDSRVKKTGLWSRFVHAVQESHMRRAEIEIRRYKALMADTDPGFKDALLPFRGE